MDPITPVEVNNVAQPVVEVARDMWEDDALANCLLAQLKTLKVEAIPAGGRPVPQSYKKWSALDAKQRDKVKLFHNSCSNAVQSVVVSRARNFLADELAAAELAANAATMRTENTTKSDYARAIHIYNDPRLVGFFVEAYSPVVERAILDDNQDRTDMSGGWKKIDDAFNDYVSYTYQNATIRYAQPIDMDGVLGGHPIKMVPYQARSDELVGMADRCHALDPSDSSRPVRDIAWIKDLYRKLRAELSKLRQSYHKSGNMDAEDQNAEWLKFCGNVPDWAAYAFVVLEDAAMDQLGKAKPDGSQLDTGVLGRGGRGGGGGGGRDEETPASRKKQRRAARAAERALQASGGRSGEGNETPSQNIHATLATAVQTQQQNAALQFLAQHDTGAGQQAALNAIRKIAGLVLDDDPTRNLNGGNHNEYSDDVASVEHSDEEA